MARQIIDTTTNNGTYIGDPAKVAFEKANENFAELYSSSSLSSVVSGANLLINPEMIVNQRVFSGGALAEGVYGYDAWKAGAGGCNISSTNGSITHASGPIVQIIKDPRLAGMQVTFSALSPTASISVSVAGVSGVIPAGTGRKSVTLQMSPSLSGNVTVTVTATAAQYSQLKLERGSFATNFTPKTFDADLRDCMPYYEKSYTYLTRAGVPAAVGRRSLASSGAAGATNYFSVEFSVVKQGATSVTVYNFETGAAGVVADESGGTSVASIGNVSEKSFEISWTNAAGRWGAWFHFVAVSELS